VRPAGIANAAISDPAGGVLFKMRNKKAAWHRRLLCEDERGTELFRIQRKFRWCTLPHRLC
jgi:uncharacterized protein YxjI